MPPETERFEPVRGHHGILLLEGVGVVRGNPDDGGKLRRDSGDALQRGRADRHQIPDVQPVLRRLLHGSVPAPHRQHGSALDRDIFQLRFRLAVR